MGIKDLFKKNMAKSEQFKEMENQMKLQKMLEERQKSSNERELERFYEEEREKSIKKNLEEFRAHRNKEAQKTTVLSGKNMFKNNKNIMTGHTSILKNNDRMLNMKPAKKSKGMFFK